MDRACIGTLESNVVHSFIWVCRCRAAHGHPYCYKKYNVFSCKKQVIGRKSEFQVIYFRKEKNMLRNIYKMINI